MRTQDESGGLRTANITEGHVMVSYATVVKRRMGAENVTMVTCQAPEGPDTHMDMTTDGMTALPPGAANCLSLSPGWYSPRLIPMSVVCPGWTSRTGPSPSLLDPQVLCTEPSPSPQDALAIGHLMPPRRRPSENFTAAICRQMLVCLRWKYGVSADVMPRTMEEVVQ
jgi:hypothetical protein